MQAKYIYIYKREQVKKKLIINTKAKGDDVYPLFHELDISRQRFMLEEIQCISARNKDIPTSEENNIK